MVSESKFYQKHKNELEQLLKKYDSLLLNNIVPFWTDRVEDREYGGYFNCFTREGKLYNDTKVGWFVGRDLYTFSALINMFGKNDRWERIADEGFRYLRERLEDENGRFRQQLSRDGKEITGFISIFTDHFAVKGIYEYMKAKGLEKDPEMLQYAEKLTEQLLEDVKDPEILKLQGIPRGKIKHPISFMTLVTLLESRKIFGNRYDAELRKYVENVLYKFADDDIEATFELINEDGTPELKEYGRIMDAGHSMESMWFAMKASEELEEPEYFRRAEKILNWIWERAYDQERDGFIIWFDVENRKPERKYLTEAYTDDVTISWNDKVWWVEAEGLNALIKASLMSESEEWFARFKKFDQYVDRCFLDPEFGEWYSVLNNDNSMKYDMKGFESKGPYHVPRAMMTVIDTIASYLNGTLTVYRLDK